MPLASARLIARLSRRANAALVVVLLVAVAGLGWAIRGHGAPPPNLAGAATTAPVDPAAVSRSTATPEADVGAVLDQMAADGAGFGVDLTAISVVDLATGQRWQVNGDRQMSFMSSAKFPWVVMATANAGVDATEWAATATFQWSDNDAAAELIELAGGLDQVNDVWNPLLGMDRTCHQHWFGAWYSGSCGADLEPPFDVRNDEFTNHSTANDLTTFLTRLWQGQIPGLDDEGRAAVLSWSLLSSDDFDPGGDGTLSGYLPPAVQPVVHHKVGWDFDGYLSAADVGIVELPSGGAYAVAMAAYGGADSAKQQHHLARASCELYRRMAHDSGWSCPAQLAPPEDDVPEELALAGPDESEDAEAPDAARDAEASGEVGTDASEMADPGTTSADLVAVTVGDVGVAGTEPNG